MNIFERAARAQLRYPSNQGDLTTEQLFQLNLKAPSGRASLDDVGRRAIAELKAFDVSDSLVDDKPTKAESILQLRVDVIKHIIESKKADLKAVETRVQNEQEYARLNEILAKKNDAKLEQMDDEAIRKRMAELKPSQA